MTKKTTKSVMLFSALALSAILVPGLYIIDAQAIQTRQAETGLGQIFGMFQNPESMGSAMGQMIGGVGGPAMLQDILMLIFGQVRNFNDREFLPNVFVLNATASSSTEGVQHIEYEDAYTQWVPYGDTSDNYYYVTVNRSVNVNVTFRQEASLVLILWDDDGSLIRAIKKLLAVVNEAIDWVEENPGAEPSSIPDSLIQQAASTATWFVMHINDIITGDEQIIFQPTYYWTYDYTGDIVDTRTWVNASSWPREEVNSTMVSFSPEALEDDTMQYLLQPSVSKINETVSDSGFLFHIFQLWIQQFQIHINMTKLAGLLGFADGGGNVTGDMVSGLLEGIDIKFMFTQHHLLGGVLFNDTDSNGVPSVDWTTTDYTYEDSDGIEKNVTQMSTNEVLFKMDLASAGPSPWTVKPPTPDLAENSLDWGVRFNDPTLRITPVGMDDYDAALSNSIVERGMEYMDFGFSFTPSFENVPVPNPDGSVNRTVSFGKGVVKLNQAFGNLTSPLPAGMDGLDLAVVYFSHIFKFDFAFLNTPDAAADSENYYHETTGTIDFLDSSDADYFGAIDIAGPDYETRGTTYPAQTAIIPFAMFEYTYNAERNVANDEFSTAQGEAAFRRQSVYFGLSSAWAFYCVSYPEWDGNELVHDPTFSIFMTLENETPWGIILLIVAIGGIVAAAMMLYFKRQGRF